VLSVVHMLYAGRECVIRVLLRRLKLLKVVSQHGPTNNSIH
jgi:hypothetical protein